MDQTDAPLIDRGKSMLDQLLRIAQTRLEMLSVEIQREKLELSRSIRLGIAVAVFAWLAGFSLILWVALVLPPDMRSMLLAGLFVVLAVASVGCWIALRRRAVRQPIFSRVIDQLQLDRASLGPEP